MSRFQKILVPVDFSDHSAAALDAAIELAKAFSGARIDLLHCYAIQPVGVAGGLFQLELAAQVGVQYSVEASTNLVDWLVLETFIATESPVLWSDADSTNFTYRFYRSTASAP